MYIISQFFLQPYFIDSALEEAAINGITNTADLALIKAEAYPHFLDIMAILFVLNIVIMLLIGLVKPRKEAFVQVYTEEVDITPWKHTKIVGIAICTIVIGVYVYFA